MKVTIVHSIWFPSSLLCEATVLPFQTLIFEIEVELPTIPQRKMCIDELPGLKGSVFVANISIGSKTGRITVLLDMKTPSGSDMKVFADEWRRIGGIERFRAEIKEYEDSGWKVVSIDPALSRALGMTSPDEEK